MVSAVLGEGSGFAAAPLLGRFAVRLRPFFAFSISGIWNLGADPGREHPRFAAEHLFDAANTPHGPVPWLACLSMRFVQALLRPA